LPFAVSIVITVDLASGRIYCIGWSFTFPNKRRANLLVCSMTFSLVSLLIIRRSMWMYCRGVSHRHSYSIRSLRVSAPRTA
ncbi:hypothetical protein F5148DRAFT_1212953, partial [Russula earlei]